MRLDHFIARTLRISEREAKSRIAAGEISVAGVLCTDLRCDVTRFDEVRKGDTILQPTLTRLYLKLHKPDGVLSATSDPEHETVIDLIDHPDKETLHLAGRLDRSSSGLILLTNDSHWSESLTHPDHKIDKVYLVETDRPIPESAVERFATGFYFESEDITTLPAKLKILAPNKARVTLQEGRWHQIKRMFHRLDGIRLTKLHREQIGRYTIGNLQPGEWLPITLPDNC